MGGLITGCIFCCLQVDKPVNVGAYKWGTYNRMYFLLFTGR